MTPKIKLKAMMQDLQSGKPVDFSWKIHVFKGLDADTLADAWLACANALSPILDTPEEIYKLVDTVEQKVTCKKGCSYCCYVNVEIFDFEADRLWKLYKHNKESILRSQAECSMMEHIKLPKDRAACVFLENDSCSIYNDRPYACRALVVNSPAKNCDTYNDPETMAHMMFSLKNVVLEGILYNIFNYNSIAKSFIKRIEAQNE